MNHAQSLIDQFGRMVSRDGGRLELLSDDGAEIRIGFHSGAVPECDTGACALPHLELQQLMAETLARRAPGLRLLIVPLAA